jgi:hypothetical protein
VLANSTSGDQHFYEIVTLYRPPPHQDWGRARTAGNRLHVMTKSQASAEGNNYPENGLVKPPRRDTRALSPAGVFGGKAPRRLAALKNRVHAPSVPMRSAPAYFFGLLSTRTKCLLNSALVLSAYTWIYVIVFPNPPFSEEHTVRLLRIAKSGPSRNQFFFKFILRFRGPREK